MESILCSTYAAELVETLYTLIRRLSLSLTAVAAQSALASALIDAFLPAEEGLRAALSPTQVAFAIGLVSNAVACLDKGSTLFNDIASPDSALARCVDYALQSVATSSTTSSEPPVLKVFSSSNLADFGAAQLLAVVLNKVRVESQCEAVLVRAVATLQDMENRQDLSAVPVHVQLLVWTTRAVSMRPNLKLAAQVTPSAPTWQEYFTQRIVSLLCAVPAGDDASSAFFSTLRLQLASALYILTTDHAVVLSLALRPSATATGLFWKQKLWSRTFGPLSQSKTKTAADEADHMVVSQLPVLNLLAVCALVTGMPTNILQDSMKDLVSIVVMAVSRSQSTSADSTNADGDTNTASALAQQSLRTLETLLNHDAQLFVPYLNIIVPALMEVSQAKFNFFSCEATSSSDSSSQSPFLPDIPARGCGEAARHGPGGAVDHHRARAIHTAVPVQDPGEQGAAEDARRQEKSRARAGRPCAQQVDCHEVIMRVLIN